MAEKGGETGGGGGKSDDQKSGSRASRRQSADRRYASPLRRRSPGRRRRSSRRPRRASSPRRSPSPPWRTREQMPISRNRICASPPGRSPSTPLEIYASPPRSSQSPGPPGRCPSTPLGHRICASPPRWSVSPGCSATAPQERVSSVRQLSSPRTSGRGDAFEKQINCQKDDSWIHSRDSPASCRKRAGEPDLESPVTKSNTRVPRRLDFDGKTSVLKEDAVSVNENKNVPDCARNTVSIDEKKSRILGNKRARAINPDTDSIWNNTHGSTGRVLGTLSFDLAKETIFLKKSVSSTVSNVINSKENVTKTGGTEQPEQQASRTTVGCSITGQNHKLFICQCELSRSAKLGAAVVENKVIPGGTDETTRLVRKSCEELNGMINAVTGSHTRDMCYNGSLLLENFRVTEDGDVKLLGIEPASLTKVGAKLDNAKVADIIEHEIFAGTVIPRSVSELLKLLRTGETRDEEAMSKSVSLMTEKERLSTFFEWMLKTVEVLERSDPTAYKAIIGILKAHRCWDDWQTKAKNNVHLFKILNYTEPGTGKPIIYPVTVKGLMRFVRNSIEHLPKHSFDPTTGESLYYLHEIDHIVSGTYEGLFEVLQGALSSTGKL